MTAIEPTTPLNSQGLVSRQAGTTSYVAPAQRPLSELEAQAKMVAAVPADMLPKMYQRNPGACMLAIDWASRNQVSILEAIGEVAFVHGKPVVSARLQKKLAARVGYRTQKLSGDDTQCTVAVIGPDGVQLGEATYTLATAQALGIASGPVWKADPAQMLFHRATTRALDHYGPADLAGVFADPYEAPDPVDTVQPVTEQAPGKLVSHHTGFTPSVEVPGPDQLPLVDVTVDDLKAALKSAGKRQGDALRAVQEQLGGEFESFELIAADPQAVDYLLGWIG